MNPYDVFPPMNLPYEATEWGRTVQDRIVDLENTALGSNEALSGQNRTSAASLQVLARQLSDLGIAIQDVQDLYNALPKAAQDTTHRTGFGLSTAGWNTVATVSFTAPLSGTAVISATGTGMQSATANGLTNMSVRLALGNSTSPSIPGSPSTPYGTWLNNYLLGYGWTVNVTAGQVLTISLQLNPAASGTWGTSPDSYAVLSAFATFSG